MVFLPPNTTCLMSTYDRSGSCKACPGGKKTFPEQAFTPSGTYAVAKRVLYPRASSSEQVRECLWPTGDTFRKVRQDPTVALQQTSWGVAAAFGRGIAQEPPVVRGKRACSVEPSSRRGPIQSSPWPGHTTCSLF